jgi:hypothetical protein
MNAAGKLLRSGFDASPPTMPAKADSRVSRFVESLFTRYAPRRTEGTVMTMHSQPRLAEGAVLRLLGLLLELGVVPESGYMKQNWPELYRAGMDVFGSWELAVIAVAKTNQAKAQGAPSTARLSRTAETGAARRSKHLGPNLRIAFVRLLKRIETPVAGLAGSKTFYQIGSNKAVIQYANFAKHDYWLRIYDDRLQKARNGDFSHFIIICGIDKMEHALVVPMQKVWDLTRRGRITEIHRDSTQGWDINIYPSTGFSMKVAGVIVPPAEVQKEYLDRFDRLGLSSKQVEAIRLELAILQKSTG